MNNLILTLILLNLCNGFTSSFASSFNSYERKNVRPKMMQRQIFFNGFPMNNNYMMNNLQNTCNCINLKHCNPLMDMARTMYNGVFANLINSQLQIYMCKYQNDEMYVCCPNFNGFDNNYKKFWQNVPNYGYQTGRNYPIGVDEDSEEDYDRSSYQQYTSYPIQGFLPYTKSKIMPTPKLPFVCKHEDPESKKNLLQPISKEFRLDTNQTFVNQTREETTTVKPAVTTQSTIQSKMSLINQDKCGRSSDSRIIGGEESGVGQFLWIARLVYRNKTSELISYRCAGNLISERYVLTAAHCVSNLVSSLELFMVRLGENDVEQENECNESGFCVKEEDFKIERITPHPNYNRPRFSNDIALIRLDQPVLSESIVPICLPIGAYENFGRAIETRGNGIIAGFGATSRTSDAQSSKLLWIRLPFVETAKCAAFYANYSVSQNTVIMISNNQLCVQGRDAADACAGDSGAPLMNEADIGNNRYVLLGLVSFGPQSCGLAKFPGVYTRIAPYMEWILSNINF